MNDSELAILGLIAEQKQASGYGLTLIARARGMERWAGLSASSIYKGLRRLEDNGFVKASPDLKKRGKGPPRRLLALTTTGSKSLRRQLTEGLLAASEQSTRYRLSLAFVEIVGVNHAIEQLQRRLINLQDRVQDVEQARATNEKRRAPFGALLLFEYVLHGLEQEQTITAKLIDLLMAEGKA